MPEWFNLMEIALLLAACYACHVWGIHKGVTDTISLLLEKNVITPQDLENLNDE